jgi:hypothetical protein
MLSLPEQDEVKPMTLDEYLVDRIKSLKGSDYGGNDGDSK